MPTGYDIQKLYKNPWYVIRYKDLEDQIAYIQLIINSLPSGGGGGNIADSDLTFNATHFANLDSHNWTIENGGVNIMSWEPGAIIVGDSEWRIPLVAGSPLDVLTLDPIGGGDALWMTPAARYSVPNLTVAVGDSTTISGGISLVGNDNIAIGGDSMQNASPQTIQSIGIGSATLQNINEIQQAIAIGHFSQQMVHGTFMPGDGDENVSIGHESLQQNVGNIGGGWTGSYNIALGTHSLTVLNGGDYNTALGHNSGLSVSDGYRNVIIGFESAATSLTTGNDNVTIGVQAENMFDLFGIGNGQDNNVVIGNLSSSYGSNHTIIGSDSHINAPTAAVGSLGNIILGSFANTNGIFGVTIGYTASQVETFADVVIGAGALSDQSSLPYSSGNVVIGYNATSVGHYNTNVGVFSNAVGIDNTMLGNFQDTIGNDNVLIGDTSSIGNSGVPGSPSNNNVLIGAGTGGGNYIDVDTNYNIILGSGSRTSPAPMIPNVEDHCFRILNDTNYDIELYGAKNPFNKDSHIDLSASLNIATPAAKFSGQISCGFENHGSVAADQTPNINDGNIQKWTLTGSINFNAPTNVHPGTTIFIIVQDGVGGHTITWNAVYKFPGGTPPVLSAAGETDVVTVVFDQGTNTYLCASIGGYL